MRRGSYSRRQIKCDQVQPHTICPASLWPHMCSPSHEVLFVMLCGLLLAATVPRISLTCHDDTVATVTPSNQPGRFAIQRDACVRRHTFTRQLRRDHQYKVLMFCQELSLMFSRPRRTGPGELCRPLLSSHVIQAGQNLRQTTTV